MKNKFLSLTEKGRWLIATLTLIFTLGIGQMWADLTAHTPGVYEKTTDKGGYGCTLTTVASGANAGTFEVYYFSANSKYGNTTDVYGGGSKQQYRLMCADDDSEYQLINTSSTSAFTNSCDWIEMAYATTGFSKSDYTYSSAFNEFFATAPNGGNTSNTKTCFIKPKEGDVLTLQVSGYVEFAILGNDNGSSKYMTITVDGGTPTSWKSNTLSRRAVSLTTGEHTIVVACVGNSANAFYGFSLKLPSCDDANASIIANTSVYVNDELDLEFSSDNTNSVVYDIKKGGSATSDASVTAGVFKATVAGTYVVTATQAKDASGHCAVDESVTITVNSKTPVSSVSISGDATAYIGIAKTLTATADQAVSEYKWEVDGVDQGVDAASFNFLAAAAGTYSVVCKARNSFNDPGEYIASSAHEIVVTKLCGELIRATRNGKNLDPVTGVVGGTATKNTQDGGKLGSSGHYWKLVLASGNFMIGDVVTVNVSTAAGQGTLAITTDQAGANVVATAGGVGVVGDNELTITETVGNTIWLSRDGTNNNWNGVVDAIYVTRSCAISDDCSIKSLTINGEAITPSAKVYSYEVAAASALTEVAVAYTIHPLATGTPASGFNVTVPAAGDPANTQTITVTAEDGTHSDTYTVSVTKAAAASDVVTLDALGVTGYTMDPVFDAGTLAYTITKAYGAEDPGTDKVTYTKTETEQTVDVAYDGTNHKLTVTVTAEDNTTTQDYVITINEAEAPKSLSRVLFSNGFDAFIDNTHHTVKAYYLEGATVPTATTITAGAGTAGEYAEGKITVTGADASSVDYIVTLEAVTPNTTTVAEEAEAGEFAGNEAWVKNGLLIYGNAAGYSVGDKWYVNRRLTKSGDAADDQRVIAGWVRSYFFVGNASKFIMTVGGNKKLKYSVDGGEAVAVEPTTLEITLTAGNHMIEIVSNQSSGDCRLSAPKLVEMPTLYDVTYSAGEGSVKDGETLPTQAATMEGGKFNLASSDALEKSGYDFAGWLCSADALTYNAGDEYTMTAVATTFTAQWVEHIVPVDPTLTYNDGAYTTGLAALDLNSLIDVKESTGAITYSVKEANGTGAAIDGVNFTATAAGTAVITASQAAVSGYNAKTVDFNVVVSEPTEVDGIKMVEAGALTGNFRVKASQLKEGAYSVEGINYAKYVQMGSTHTSFSGETEGNQAKGIYYAPAKKNIKFWFYMRNTESTTTRKIYIYTIEEGESITSQTVEVEAGSHLVSADITLSKNAEIVFGVDNTKLCFCQIVAVESGDDLLQGGQAGYVFDYSKKRQNVAANTLRTIDGIDYKLSAESKINSASNVQLTTLGTHYIKFHLDAQMQVKVYADNKKYYIGSECSTEDAAKLYEATGDGEFTLAAGDWYINGSGAQVKINKLEFALPKCAKPVVADLDNVDYCTGETIDALTVSATVSDGGTMLYQWYKDGVAIEGADEATYQPKADAEYYVVVVNTLTGHQNSDPTQSNTITVTGHAGTVISGTTGAEDWPGEDVTISVEASGKNLSYAWYTCDDALGTNPVAVDPAVNAAELNVTVAAADSYYKVIVSGDCGSAQEAVITVVARQAVEQVNVTEATVWNFATSIAGSTSLENQTDVVLANVDGINNNASFNSQALKGTFNKMPGNYFQGSKLSFTTEVAGMLRVIFRGTNNNSRHLQICVGEGEEVIADWDYKGSGEGAEKDSAIYVPAGKVTLKALEGTAAQNARIYRMELVTEDSYHRTVNPSNIGTLCWTNDAVLGGATLYELAGKDANSKLVFDEVPENRLEAGKPYIFVPENGNTVIKVYNTTDDEPLTAPLDAIKAMQGTFVDMTTVGTTEGDGDLWYKYIISNNHYIYVDYQNCNLGAYRAYFHSIDAIPAASEEPQQGSNGAPRRRLVVGGNNVPAVTTGVDNLNVGDQPIKVIIDGQMYILRGDKMYDATGRLVK